MIPLSKKLELKNLQENERSLLRTFDKTPFESLTAMERINGDKVLQLLDYVALFDLLNQSIPDGNQAILNSLITENLITKNEAGRFNITNFGARRDTFYVPYWSISHE